MITNKDVAAQRQWMAQCGGNLAGYVANYGSKDAPVHSGDGGEMIYAADVSQLAFLLLRTEGKRVDRTTVYAETCRQLGLQP